MKKMSLRNTKIKLQCLTKLLKRINYNNYCLELNKNKYEI